MGAWPILTDTPASGLYGPVPLGPACSLIAESPAVYRPRRPERTVFYRLLDEHFDDYVSVHEDRFERRFGPLRPVVPKTVAQFLDCGRLHGGFARLRCPSCKAEHLIAFSCRSRNFCPSCQAKRAALFAEKLRHEILAPVPHRHIVFTIPKALRGLFERERRLLSVLSRSAYDAVHEVYASALGRNKREVRPGFVASLQTFGGYACNFHPHVHALASEGAFLLDGTFLPLSCVDALAIEEVFRRLVLERLVRKRRLSAEFRDTLLTWEHSGFSVHAKLLLFPDEPHGGEPQKIEHLARYLTRAPIRLDALNLGPDGVILVDTPPHPTTGEASVCLDPLDWIHAITTQIPDPRQHLVRYFGAYSNRARGAARRRAEKEREPDAPFPTPLPHHDPEDSHFAKATKASWARLLGKLFEVDPCLCPRCGDEMRIVSVITEPEVVDRILRHIARNDIRDPFEQFHDRASRAPPDSVTLPASTSA